MPIFEYFYCHQAQVMDFSLSYLNKLYIAPVKVPSDDRLEDVNAALQTITTGNITETNKLIYRTSVVILHTYRGTRGNIPHGEERRPRSRQHGEKSAICPYWGSGDSYLDENAELWLNHTQSGRVRTQEQTHPGLKWNSGIEKSNYKGRHPRESVQYEKLDSSRPCQGLSW